ncbi:hypothetical protein [Peribacillus sp. V2I11]|uniref:hypothetical protein n=1 Tax=Peribacillus sp. V2I11 TaxID=3042277 RepID=UPI00278B5605|nr:hypothetical protein [Peribacillus sp. V2I11]MDQ0879256.1 hypothetical protein [Peribacillus sp. V2I11]
MDPSLDLAQLVLELINAINALKEESKIGISASKAKEMITPQRGRSWTGLGVFLEDSKKELKITLLAKRPGTSSAHSRINVKKFIQVLYFETKRSIRNH